MPTRLRRLLAKSRSDEGRRSTFLEGDLNPAYISAFAALAGAIIGRLTSFATSWITRRTHFRNAQLDAERAKLEALYTDFLAE